MKVRPILFSGAMVRALLAGRKTQTRRIISFQGIDNVVEFVKVATDPEGRPVYEMKDSAGKFVTRPAGKHFVDYNYSPRIAVGDLLWVRETWAPLSALTHNDPGAIALADGGFYRADEGTVDGEIAQWTPSIFMPRRASRITLAVTGIKIERLQDISEMDAFAEGVWHGGTFNRFADDLAASSSPGRWFATASDWYRDLWDRINGQGEWAYNPWVAVYTFTVLRANIDQVKP